MTRILAVIGPGVLVAATGVGAGDLATAALAGGRLGTAILWAVVAGAFLKFVLTEGLARWQLASGQTLLEGAIARLGRVVPVVFLPYFLLWSLFVGAALISACGVAAHAVLPHSGDPGAARLWLGLAHSVVGVILVLRGGFRLFEKVMALCIAVMFVTTIGTAILLVENWGAVARGLCVPTIPSAEGRGVGWTVALMGGVGGTLTVLCYGYWIREKGRTTLAALSTCRLDLALAYALTAVFGVAMVLIGSMVDSEGSGATLIVNIADHLAETLGPAGHWLFLLGAWAAIFSSLLGVWQSVPYVFADLLRLARPGGAVTTQVNERSLAYRGYLVLLATVPALAVAATASFAELQKLYAIVGACFMPLLALVLLILNGRRSWVGAATNRPLTVLVLLAILAFFAWVAWRT